MHPPLYKGTQLISTTNYVGVPIHKTGGGRELGVQIGWKDATSATTITLELTNFKPVDADVSTAGDAWEWVDSGETITAAVGSAAGSVMVLLSNVQARRARLKIVTTAESILEIHDGAV